MGAKRCRGAAKEAWYLAEEGVRRFGSSATVGLQLQPHGVGDGEGHGGDVGRRLKVPVAHPWVVAEEQPADGGR